MIKYSIQFADNRESDFSDTEMSNMLALELPVQCATIARNTGVWQGTTERSWSIEIIDINDDISKLDVYTYARKLKEKWQQQAVLVSESEIKAVLI